MEPGLRRTVRRFSPHRARVPGEASRGETSRAGHALDVPDAPVHVVTRRGKRTNRAGREARTIGTALAGAATVVAGRKVQAFAERDGTPIGVPQAEVRMHERPDRRRVDGARALRPADERKPGWTAERKVRGSAQTTRKARHHPPAPSVQSVRRAVGGLIRRGERGPHPGTRVADEDERRRRGAVGERRDRIVRGDVESTPARESLGLDGGDDGVKGPRR